MGALLALEKTKKENIGVMRDQRRESLLGTTGNTYHNILDPFTRIKSCWAKWMTNINYRHLFNQKKIASPSP